MEELLFSTKNKEELIDITTEVKAATRRANVKEGICVLFVPHATAALFICQKCKAFLSTLRNAKAFLVCQKSKGFLSTLKTRFLRVLTNENEPGLKEDLLNSLSYMVPNNRAYRHDRADGNASSHIKAALVGPSLSLTIHEGNIILGSWQSIFLAEFDGPRSARRVILQAVGK